MIALLRGLVDDAGLFPPSSLSMADALARHRRSTSPMLSGRFLLPSDQVCSLLGLLGDDEKLDVHLIGALVEVEDPRVTVRAVETRSAEPTAFPCYVEGVPPSELAGTDSFGKVRCLGPSVRELASYIEQCVRFSLPFKATAGLHAAVRGWESTGGQPHHGYLNILVAVGRVLSGHDAESALSIMDGDELADEGRELSGEQVRAIRWLFHSYGSCDTARPLADAAKLGLL